MKKLLLILGLTFMLASSLSAGQVLLDHVDGAWFDGTYDKLEPGVPVTFHLRLINDGIENITSLSNGFVLHSSNGATMVGSSLIEPDWFIFDWIIGGSFGNVVGFKTTFGSIPAGFDEIAYTLQTTSFVEGDIICLDSTFYGMTGVWKWSGTGGDEFPYWDGPHCFEVQTSPCTIPAPESISCYSPYLIYDRAYSRKFTAENASNENSTIRYAIIEGPGLIDNISGQWTYTPIASDFDSFQDLKVIAYNENCLVDSDTCSVLLTFIDGYIYCDFNNDGQADISDLVLLVGYMFLDGIAPTPPLSADLNGDLTIDISDLIITVNYMFPGD